MTRDPRFTIMTLTLAALAVGAHAQDAAQVSLHGFGGWAYARTNQNAYLGGLPGGDYRSSSFGFNTLATSGEHLRIHGQVEWHDDEHGGTVGLDYAFAEWRFSDALKVRVGQVKQPFGISTEVFRIGTLRPFFALPQAVYGPVGLTGGKAYKGVGLTGSLGAGAWTVAYDVYAGGVEQEEFVLGELFLRGEPATEDDEFELEATRDVVGGRLVVATPVRGLRVGGSAYTGREIGSTRRSVFGFQAEYARHPWSLRAEWAHEEVPDDVTVRGGYVEAAYRFARHWQAAVQHGRHTSDVAGTLVPAPSLLDHTETAGGINFWCSPELVLKLSVHEVRGNRLAAPEPDELADLVRTGQLRTHTRLLLLGAQFTF